MGEIVFELAVRLPGYLIARRLRPRRDIHFEGAQALLCGIAFWMLIGLAIWGAVVVW